MCVFFHYLPLPSNTASVVKLHDISDLFHSLSSVIARKSSCVLHKTREPLRWRGPTCDTYSVQVSFELEELSENCRYFGRRSCILYLSDLVSRRLRHSKPVICTDKLFYIDICEQAEKMVRFFKRWICVTSSTLFRVRI